MEVLVVYDVNTETREGRRRLRRVAKRCEAFGQRVQYSVFECILDDKGYERLQHALKEIIDQDLDSLRIYRLREPRERYLKIIGRDVAHDIHQPLIL